MSTNKCKLCSEIIKPTNKFCNRSCAASFNNRGRIRTEESRAKVSAKLKGIENKYKGVENKYKGVKRIALVPVPCYVCGSEVNIPPRKASRNHTCKSKECISKSCSISGRNSAAKRVKRSKDEIALFEMCRTHFPDAVSNYVISDGWDADIVLPENRTAILWNGPWHYKQLNIKNHSLEQVRNRDRIKIDIFKNLGWRVYVFEDRYYTPEQAFMVVRDGTAPPSTRYERVASL